MEDVRELFDRTSRSYDILNHLFSFSVDAAWRRRLVRESGAADGSSVLDLCTGTADVAISFARRLKGARVTGLDFSSRMLERARAKVARAGLADRIELREGDALNLPWPAGSFQVVCNSFGLRTLGDRARAVGEMARVASSGGSVLILEFLPPPPTLFGALYSWHLHTLMPAVGGALSGYRRSYTYLSETVVRFPSPDKVMAMMERAGLQQVTAERLTGGIACLFQGIKP
jgi:demethylmenaquinone methyltransferase / 2-methoxy-6-polyprenyl-1,4-benzoquinol methylase